MVTLSTLQPRVGFPVTIKATLTRPGQHNRGHALSMADGTSGNVTQERLADLLDVQ